MSDCTNLVCTKCKKSLWVGQNNHLYLNDREVMKALEIFLLEHHDHELKYLRDSEIEWLDDPYEVIDIREYLDENGIVIEE